MANKYITLEASDASISERFRVAGGAEGDYDDGTLQKSQEINKTIGGGIDASVGAVYTIWHPTIMVRHTEDVANYGDLSDLVSLYSLNDPGGTPTNVITFTDHHDTSHSVIMIGDFIKQTLGVSIEGLNAWHYVRLELHEVP